MNDTETKKYKIKFLPFFIVVFLVLTFCILLYESTNLQTFNLCKIKSVLIFTFSWSFISSIIVTLFLTTDISINSIKGYDVFGRKKFVEWNEITRCKYTNFFGLKYIKLFHESSRWPVWIPLYLKDINGFSDEIIKIVPENNCLRNYFDARLNNYEETNTNPQAD
ncbi:MAG: hypothetical protein ABFR02_01770 [Campylobacterota bacterium]